MQKIGKEVKIGLGVIGLLVAIFGFILIRRLSRPDDLPVAAASSQAPATGAANSPEKPIVVSATNAAHPADANGPAASSNSLFTTPQRSTNDTADGNEGRGSMMPDANRSADHDVAGPSSFPASAANPMASGNKNEPQAGRSMFTSGAPLPSSRSADSGTNLANRFSRRDAPSDAANSSSVPAHQVTPAAASLASVPPPGATPDSASPLGSSPGDPFQQKSANLSALDKPSSATITPPATPSAGAGDVAEANPLRHSPDGMIALPARSPADDIASSSIRPRNGTDAGGLATPPIASGGFSPPPITSNAINVPNGPTASAMPGEPVRSTGVPTVAGTQNADAPPPFSPVVPASAADSAAHKPGQYVVQPDDNYWAISEKVYGTGGYFKAVYEHNRRQRAQADRLQVGDVLDVPPAATLEQMYPDLCPKSASASGSAMAATPAVAPAARPGMRMYSVADGDTLYEIARHELGSPSRWGEIYQLNHDQLGNDFSYLRPGTQLLLPNEGSVESIARDPNAAMQR